MSTITLPAIFRDQPPSWSDQCRVLGVAGAWTADTGLVASTLDSNGFPTCSAGNTATLVRQSALCVCPSLLCAEKALCACVCSSDAATLRRGLTAPVPRTTLWRARSRSR
jgi:hypothetical protein